LLDLERRGVSKQLVGEADAAMDVVGALN